MEMRAAYAIFTMDCERVQPRGSYGLEGPGDWEMSRKAISGFAEVLMRKGRLGTFFVVPETAHRQRSLFLELEKDGFELGLHYHPQLYRAKGYSDFLGGYSYEEQLRQLREAREDWAQAFGRLPESFRPGNFSANDSTFRVLYDLGFRQGSISAPEREVAFYRAVWRGSPAHPHHVHPNFRLIEGDLDFFDVPVTVDPSRRVWEDTSASELRIELSGVDGHALTIDRRLKEMVEKEVGLKTLVSITHNMFDYSKGEDPHRGTLEATTDYIDTAAGRFALSVLPETIRGIHRLADGQE